MWRVVRIDRRHIPVAIREPRKDLSQAVAFPTGMTVSIVTRVLCAFVVLGVVFAMQAPRSRAETQDCEYGAFGCGHTGQHDQYQEWKPRSGKGNCCNGEDCRPVKARLEDDGSWSVWIPEFRLWILVPDFAVGEPDRFGDGRSHVCSTKPMATLPSFHIFCFSPTGSKS
jgi:hypothetical protein